MLNREAGSAGTRIAVPARPGAASSAERILFVYNANSGWGNALLDLTHKILSPSTYPCSLCALTWSPLGMRRKWRSFVKDLPAPVRFLHRDEIEARRDFPGTRLPAVFLERAGGLAEWVSAREIDACSSLDELIGRIRDRLATDPDVPGGS